MMDDNQKRALSIFWLDGGKHPARSIALKNNVSVEELECELSIFKTSNIYRQQYEPVIIEDIKKVLTGFPFKGWDKHICMRTLPNGRIECIIGETLYKRKFYHAYIPDKEYVNQIFSHSVFSCQQDFFNLTGIKDELQWETFPVNQQLNLLLDFYDSEVFIPYRRLITRNEDWIREYTGYDVEPDGKKLVPLPESLQKNIQQNSPRIVNRRPNAFSQTENIMQSVSSLTMDISEMLEQKMAVWKNESGELLHKTLSSKEINILREKISQKEEIRLENIYTRGLEELSDIEKDMFVYIDPFYEKYGLKQAILANSEILLHSAADAALKDIVKEESDIYDEKGNSPNIMAFDNIVASLHILLGEEYTNIQKDIQVTNIRKILIENEDDTTLVSNLWDLLQNQGLLNVADNPFVEEIYNILEDYGFIRESYPSETMHETDIISQRKALLEEIAHKGTTPDLIEKLQQTENEITHLPFNKFPDGYPENNQILYQLYWSNIIKTTSEVCSMIIHRLSTEEIAALCNKIAKS